MKNEINIMEEEIWSNIYLADKKMSQQMPLVREENYQDYLIGKETILRTSNKKNLLKYWIISPQLVDPEEKSLQIIEVDQEAGKISFLINKEDITYTLLSSEYDSHTKSWDVRTHIKRKNKPSYLLDGLKEIEQNTFLKEDGILYSETFKTMIEDINRLYEKKVEKNK